MRIARRTANQSTTRESLVQGDTEPQINKSAGQQEAGQSGDPPRAGSESGYDQREAHVFRYKHATPDVCVEGPQVRASDGIEQRELKERACEHVPIEVDPLDVKAPQIHPKSAWNPEVPR